MINCPECGRELKHKGALNGHLVWAHGIITPRQLTMDELRNEVKKLRTEMDYMKLSLEALKSEDSTRKLNGHIQVPTPKSYAHVPDLIPNIHVPEAK